MTVFPTGPLEILLASLMGGLPISSAPDTTWVRLGRVEIRAERRVHQGSIVRASPLDSLLPPATAPRGDSYWIQLLATPSRAEAEALVGKWRATNKEPAILVLETSYYKVRIGPYSTAREAQVRQRALRATGYPEAWVVRGAP